VQFLPEGQHLGRATVTALSLRCLVEISAWSLSCWPF
jgi:hypothetical protein